ncbi:decapping and exoribonuclease protein-like [Strongylocentrotus purpuratus]|uniref:Decapping nuclease n=1 Tax=Strongylocentrotus purpuratus TaxID=7668 RepID=A0A7M7NVF7_STRPU|nr:decapping and exoribonuclease protein-like [Strongylocentrotus purpuratus]
MRMALGWWAANKIAGIPEIRCGLRDDKHRTIKRIETIETDRLATSRYTKGRWNPKICIRTMESLLSQIKELVPEDDPNSIKQAVLIIRPVEEGPGVNRTFEIRDRLPEDQFVEEDELQCIFGGNE